MDSFASRLVFRRKQLKLNQTQAATRAGLGQTDISKIERGDVQETAHILRLAQALECNPYWLRYGEGEMLEAFKPPLPKADEEIQLMIGSLVIMLKAIPAEKREGVVNEALRLWLKHLPSSEHSTTQAPPFLVQEGKPTS